MSHYLVFARKYRPADFDEVVGQDAIVERLREAVRTRKVAHAYLFSGPRGVGKTTCARILARCLNCEKGPTPHPCGECPSCREIAQGSSFDVLEIDAASNRGIDEIRTLRENVKFAPGFGRYKVYIIDEVHMLTTEAFNALLKTLEEPPEHVKFVLATTDPQKLPETVISRCQRFDFKRANIKTLVDVIQRVCAQENLQIDDNAVYAVAKAADGSVRDALSILDQLSALSERRITAGDVSEMLGVVETDLMFSLVDAIIQGLMNDVLQRLDDIVAHGKDMKQLNKDLIEHMRNMMVLKIGGKNLSDLVDEPGTVKQRYWEQGKALELSQILEAIETFIEAQEIARITEAWRIPLELAFAKLVLRWHPQKEKHLAVEPFDVNTVVQEIFDQDSEQESLQPKGTQPLSDSTDSPEGKMKSHAATSQKETPRTAKRGGAARRTKKEKDKTVATNSSGSEDSLDKGGDDSAQASNTMRQTQTRANSRSRTINKESAKGSAVVKTADVQTQAVTNQATNDSDPHPIESMAAHQSLNETEIVSLSPGDEAARAADMDEAEEYSDTDTQWGGEPPEALTLSDSDSTETQSNAVTSDGTPDETLTLEIIERQWPSLTQALSRHKMSLATLLQEGVPVHWESPWLTVAFSEEHEFHKETVEEHHNKELIETVFTEALKTPVRLKLQLGEVADEMKVTMDIAEDENVDDVLKEFKGKIVNRWHNDV